MLSLSLAIAFLSGGIALSMGLVSLFIGLHKDGEKVDLVFGILCILMFLFFVFPPFGFVMMDRAPYSTGLIIKRIFNFSFFGLFPWFVFYYTGYRNKWMPLTINAIAATCYIWMALTQTDREVPYWIYVSILGIALIIIHGFTAMHFLFARGFNKQAKWFRFALMIFLVLFSIWATVQLGNAYFYRVFHIRVFYPLNLFPLAFIIIMGIRMHTHSLDKFRLERTLGLKNQQWESMLNRVQLIVVRLDMNGKVQYINPFGVNLLEYKDASEIVNKNWFDYFLSPAEAAGVRNILKNLDGRPLTEPSYKNSIITREGNERIIVWNNELIFEEKGVLAGVMSIGSDVTEKEQSFQKIQQLKSELEKENLMLKGEPIPEWMQQEIIGKSEAISYAIQKAGKVASSQASVLLEGETGVGKELFADMIQRNSMRLDKPFIKVNCGALPAELIEDELFGHEKGAFTGAQQARKGRFEMANGGTIFLDEIGELPIQLQPKLLRVLQNGEFERVGGQESIKVDVRIIAATNRDLEQEVKAGRFRDDLYYRLNVYPITIPPLRSRKEDVPMLIQYYIDKKSKKHDKSFKSISKADMNTLMDYDWPGNIRELRNVIERSVISSDHDSVLRLDWFYTGIREKATHQVPVSLEQMEREFIIKVLQDCHWRISGEHGAAEKLVMNASTLRSKMKKLNITRQGD